MTLSEKFQEVHQLAQAVARKSIPTLVVAGSPGIGKSFTVQKALSEVLGEPLDGRAEIFDPLQGPYQRVSDIVFGDHPSDSEEQNFEPEPVRWIHFDHLLSEEELCVSLYRGNFATLSFERAESILANESFKATIDSLLGPLNKKISLRARTRWNQFPDFDFMGSLVFVSDLPIDEIDPSGNIRSRTHFVDIVPTHEEMLEYIEHILPNVIVDVPADNGQIIKVDAPIEVKRKVLGMLMNGNHASDITLRKYVRALVLYIKERKRMDPKTLQMVIARTPS